MTQNILALIIVFSAAIISVYSIVKSITSKKASHCDGCSACETKNVSPAKSKNRIPDLDFQQMKIASLDEK